MKINDVIFYMIVAIFAVTFLFVLYAIIKGYCSLFYLWKDKNMNPLSVIFTFKYSDNNKVKEFKREHNKRFIKIFWLFIPIIILTALLIFINFKN